MSSNHESKTFEQLKARIEEFNNEESQALARSKEEREKRHQTMIESREKDDSDE